MADYAQALGARLRAIRNQQGLSLQGVEDKSHGRWKAVVVGSYERGDRAVTVQRLSELAVFYGVPVSELLPEPRLGRQHRADAADRAEPRAARARAGRRGRARWRATPRPSRPAGRLQRQGALDPAGGPHVARDHLRHEPRRAHQQLIEWGVLSAEARRAVSERLGRPSGREGSRQRLPALLSPTDSEGLRPQQPAEHAVDVGRRVVGRQLLASSTASSMTTASGTSSRPQQLVDAIRRIARSTSGIRSSVQPRVRGRSARRCGRGARRRPRPADGVLGDRRVGVAVEPLAEQRRAASAPRRSAS